MSIRQMLIQRRSTKHRRRHNETQAPAPPTARKTVSDAAPKTPLTNDRPPRRSRRKLVLGAIAILAAGVGGWFGYDYVTVGRFTVSTDDAYVQAYNTTLAAESRRLCRQRPGHRQHLRPHRRCDRHYRRRRLQARCRLRTRESRDPGGDGRPHGTSDLRPGSSGRADAHPACLRASRCQAHGARAQSPECVVAKDWSSRQLQEQAQANRDQASAAVQGALAAIDSAVANRRGAQGTTAGSDLDPRRAQDRAGQGRARSILYGYPRADRWRGRQSRGADRRLCADRPAACELGALGRGLCHCQFQGDPGRASAAPASRYQSPSTRSPEHNIQGTVESFSPASGAVFSLLPPDNATGNFTKIVQRLPVRIHVPVDVAREGLLRPGMSVVVSVNTKSSAVADNDKPLQVQSASAR